MNIETTSAKLKEALLAMIDNGQATEAAHIMHDTYIEFTNSSNKNNQFTFGGVITGSIVDYEIQFAPEWKALEIPLEDWVEEEAEERGLTETVEDMNEQYLLECAALNYRSKENLKNTALWLLEQDKVKEAFDLFKGMKAKFECDYDGNLLGKFVVGGVSVGAFLPVSKAFRLLDGFEGFIGLFNSVAKKEALVVARYWNEVFKRDKLDECHRSENRALFKEATETLKAIEQWPETQAEDQAKRQTPF